MLTCFIYYLRIWAFRKYMSAKIPSMVQGYHILAYSLLPEKKYLFFLTLTQAYNEWMNGLTKKWKNDKINYQDYRTLCKWMNEYKIICIWHTHTHAYMPTSNITISVFVHIFTQKISKHNYTIFAVYSVFIHFIHLLWKDSAEGAPFYIVE